ncbi:MAG TPA: carboxypeptidase-like regulatory domain-containing protein [Flavitalea sp.]|nr:carboxypeptidase-like regulatory domain-containing protein [Flavitalea sp.]
MRSIILFFFVLFSTTYFANAQSRNIAGKVTDQQSHELLANVSVNVKGTIVGTTTDASGNFTLAVPGGKNILTISYIGYTPQEVPVNDLSIINISLAPGSSALNEVVVTGYTSQRKKDITGSVSLVDMKALKSVPSGSAVQALQG